MARGDFIDVTYRTGETSGSHRMQTSSIGGSVDWLQPRPNEAFIEVHELNKAGAVVRKAFFAKGDVIALIEGNVGPTAFRRVVKK